MFILHSSNKTENLFEHLCLVFENSPLSTPFAKECFLIQSQGMERWLSQQLALRFKAWSNFEFLFPNRFFGDLAKKIDPTFDNRAFDREQQLWRLDSLLRHPENAELALLQHYLAGENRALKRYQLARQLAQLFDQYQIMRSDMLAEWQAGRMFYGTDSERWQMQLWRQLIQTAGGRHRGTLWLDVIAHLSQAEEGRFSEVLPERISVFGLNTMPPLFLAYLQALSKHCELHLYLLNPAQSYWADLAGKRCRIEEDAPNGHPLLAALGQQGREFQEMLIEQAEFDFEPASFELYDPHSNLQRLQNDILQNDLTGGLLTPDGSICLHACHTRLREVEVLKDQLLAALEQDKTLELRDIVVMAPDIELYEPFINAVFDDIQHAVADRSLRTDSAALAAFSRFLSLTQSRFGWRRVMDLFEQPMIHASFGLAEDDLELIRYWLQENRVRWGISGRHKQEYGLPELNENTWQAALDRLLMGYAVGCEDDFVEGILPYPKIEGSAVQVLGGLCEFMQLLFEARQDFQQAKTLQDWRESLAGYARRLLRSADPVDAQPVYELLEDLDEAAGSGHRDHLELQVILAWLDGTVAERKSSTGFLRGQLTFCSMLPMRSIPFKVIALLGMNDGEFPKIDRPPTFDLMARHFRKGDRSRRADDRYQFLEIVLSARRQLIMTYLGRSISHNQAIPPSTVVSELLEVLERHYQLSGLVTEHPLQPFSRRYFDGGSGLFSHSGEQCATASLFASRAEPIMVWWQGAVEREDDAEQEPCVIEISDLLAFFRHPQKYFLKRQLDLRFSGIDLADEEREPFAIDGLEKYDIEHAWIEAELNGVALSLKKLQAQGRWLAGAPGELEFARYQRELGRFVGRLREIDPGAALNALPVDLGVGRYRLVGKLANRYERGSLFYRHAELKGKDLLAALLHHLIHNRLAEQTTWLFSRSRDLMLLPEDGNAEQIEAWLDIFNAGTQRPDAFFTEAALAYLLHTDASRSSKSPLEAAREQLAKALSQPYEPELVRLFGTMADPFVLIGEQFEAHCQELLVPIWLAANAR